MGIERKINVRIGEKEYLIASDDNYLEYIKNGFEPHMVAMFKTLISKNDNIFDIGANIGCTSILFGDLAKKVYAFEPSPTTYSFLRKNIIQSRMTNIDIFNIGLGSSSCESTLTFSPSNRSGGFISNLTQASKGHITEKIFIKTVDEIIETLRPPEVNLIKIDVEGFEGHVIKGAESTIIKNKPIVVLELNHWCLNAFQRTSIPDFFDLLRANFPILLAVEGNTCMNLFDESDTYIVMYQHILNMKYQNIVAAFNEKQLEKFFNLFYRNKYS